MEKPSHEHERTAEIEAKQTEYKEIVQHTLRDVFSNVLDSAELERRLKLIDKVEFVTPEQMEKIAKTNPKDAGASGLLRYEVTDTEVKRYPVVVLDPSRAETLHTLLHESVHLMSPESVPVFDPMREPEEQAFSDYVGAYRFDRLRSDKSFDHRSLLETTKQHNEHFMFWEVVTDWVATNTDALTPEELQEIAHSSYFERDFIYYLVREYPDSDELIKALKESYVQGSEDPVRWFLQKLTDTKDDQMYDELLEIIGKPRQDTSRVDDWMAVVDRYFKKTE